MVTEFCTYVFTKFIRPCLKIQKLPRLDIVVVSNYTNLEAIAANRISYLVWLSVSKLQVYSIFVLTKYK